MGYERPARPAPGAALDRGASAWSPDRLGRCRSAACTTAHTAGQGPAMMMFRALVSARCLPM